MKLLYMADYSQSLHMKEQIRVESTKGFIRWYKEKINSYLCSAIKHSDPAQKKKTHIAPANTPFYNFYVLLTVHPGISLGK